MACKAAQHYLKKLEACILCILLSYTDSVVKPSRVTTPPSGTSASGLSISSSSSVGVQGNDIQY